MRLIKNLNWFLVSQVGLNLSILFSFFANFPKFIYELIKVKLIHKGIKISIKPCLHDKSTSNGEGSGTEIDEYFFQDLFVAQKVYKINPTSLADVGSRLDGYITNVASYREISVLDIRELDFKVENINFSKIDITSKTLDTLKFDMITCLHTLEHFGLGRYGDPIVKDSTSKGIEGLSNIIKNNGTLIISTPIGKEKIEFNANWIFCPDKLNILFNSHNLEIKEFYVYDKNEKAIIKKNISDFKDLKKLDYILAIFILNKTRKNGKI